jgi:hypothetical protein
MGPKEQDFPAAHSMDTEWFAVDRDGRVAVFNSGENGLVPEGVHGHDWGDAGDDLLDWHTPPASRSGPQRYDWENHPIELVRAGAFYFYYEAYDVGRALPWSPRTAFDLPFYSRYGLSYSSFAGPYVRALVPDAFLHVDQLPPQLRRRARRYRYAGLSFAEWEFVQPAEFFSCIGWHYSSGMAYLRGDGKTLRPGPGKKHVFGRFIRDFLAGDPRRAEWFAFDWSTD